MKLIQLSRGKFAQVDNEDYEFLVQRKWYAMKASNTFYAARTIWLGNKKKKNVLMHRIIMKDPIGKEIDHKDRDGLNNQKSNLRNCTHQQNMMNRCSVKGGTSKYLGVNIKKRKYKERVYIGYVARIGQIYIGSFKSEMEAAEAYNKKAMELHGEFASLNSV